MSMNPQQAAAEIVEALESASGLAMSEEGSAWVDDWCYGEGKGGEPRPGIFASDEDDVEIGGLVGKIAPRGGDIVKLCEEKGVKEITPEVLVEIEKKLSAASGTRLCDPLLAQAAALPA